MTTRLLESFNVLDKHSKRVFNKHARKNHQLTSVVGLDFPNETEVLNSKPKIAFLNEEKSMSAQKSVSPALSMKDISSKISIRPFTSTEDLAWRTSPANVKKKDKVGFMTTTLKKPWSLRPYEPTLHRMKWSREVEKMPPLDTMNKASSTALVGGALSYTKTSHWCSSLSNNNGNVLLGAIKEEDEPFILPGSTGEVIAHQLHQGIMVRICTSESYKRAKNSPPQSNIKKDLVYEPVPLCFDDELERKSAKVLTARPPTLYTTLPIAGETYPLINNTDQEPFRSLGFHSVDCSALKSNSNFAIIRFPDSMHKVHMLRSLKKCQRGEGIFCPPSCFQSGHEINRAHSIRVLSADGNVEKYSSDGPIFLRCHDVKPSSGVFTNTSKSPPVPFPMSRQKSITKTHVGPVVNGINPKQDAEKKPSDNLKTVYKMSRGKLAHCSHVTPPQSQRGVDKQNGIDFIVISKPLKSNQSHDFVGKQQFQEEMWPREIVNMSQVIDDETFMLKEASFSVSRPLSSVDYTCQNGTPGMSTVDDPHSLNTMDERNTCSEIVGSVNNTKTANPNPHLQWTHAINIPTAESCE